jgi:hypothetical protein
MTKNETNTAPRREMKQTSHEDEKSNNVARRRGNHKNKKNTKDNFDICEICLFRLKQIKNIKTQNHPILL